MTKFRYRKSLWFWFIQLPGWILLIYLIIAQGLSAIDCDLGIRMGTQESAERITPVGVAFFKGFAFSDLIIYIPLLLIGLLGHARNKRWGQSALIAASGITIYWPVTCLVAVVAAGGAPGWDLTNVREYWLVLPLIALWGLIGLAGFCFKVD